MFRPRELLHWCLTTLTMKLTSYSSSRSTKTCVSRKRYVVISRSNSIIVASEQLFPSHYILQLMLLLIFVERECRKRGDEAEKASIAWTNDGLAVIIRDHHELVNVYLPQIFRSRGRFSSFTRKLYRWGFRQKTAKSRSKASFTSSSAKIFFHKQFQRDNKKLLADMRSAVTGPAQKKAASPPTKVRHHETTRAVISNLSIPRHENALIDLFSIRDSISSQLVWQNNLAALTAETRLTSLDLSTPSFTNYNVGQASLMSSHFDRCQAVNMARMTPSLPLSTTVGSTRLFQNELMLQFMKRKRVHDLVATAFQCLLPKSEHRNPFATTNHF